MATAYIGLGGNIGDAKQLIKDAIVCLAQRPEVKVTSRSCMYKSAPVNASGEDFINAVISIDTYLTPEEVLHLCMKVESQFGRERPYTNAPRTLDLDLLSYDDVCIASHELTIPHPRMTERAFVLLPLLELCPQMELPGFGKLANYVDNLKGQRIEKIKGCCCPSHEI